MPGAIRGRRLLWAALTAGLLGFVAAAVSLPSVIGWWLDFSDEPERSDLMVVLCGQEYSRALYAAELFKKGYAPEVWLARSVLERSVVLANSLGVKVPNEDEVMEAILLRQGVPRQRLKRYGREVVSTVGEARALREAAVLDGREVLVVTSRYHARRSKMVFQETFPRAVVRVAASPHDPFTRRWWTRRDLARQGVLEAAKTAYYLLGGSFSP
ncbi:MAG: YdcF family protein [Elusimicrobia bacterium]|nr:YdcF family protein [Elusimicrobiota bacterium]